MKRATSTESVVVADDELLRRLREVDIAVEASQNAPSPSANPSRRTAMPPIDASLPRLDPSDFLSRCLRLLEVELRRERAREGVSESEVLEALDRVACVRGLYGATRGL